MFPLPSLKRIRLKRLSSQADLAAATDLTETTISRIEHGHPARLSTIRKLARALWVEPEELMKDEDLAPGQQEAAA